MLRPTRSLTLLTLIGIAGCAPSFDAPPFEETTPDPGPSRAVGVDILSVTLSQAVAISLVQNGGELEELAAPIIEGRAAQIRVGVAVETPFEAREIRADLLVVTDEGKELLLSETEEIAGSSDLADEETTFDFVLEPEVLAPGLRLGVTLWETTGAPEGDSDGSAWPDLGTRAIPVESGGGTLRVELIPVRYDFDGSGRLPDVSSEQLGLIRDYLERLYPVRSLELTVGEEYATDVEINRDGEGIGEVLSVLRDVRDDRAIPWDVYVHALVQPRDTWEEFCALGCTAGVAYRVANPSNSTLKVGIGVGFTGERAASVLAHEIGHQHDRGHAPCGGADNVDPGFPYLDGGIGVEGWDILSGVRVDPVDTADVMAYCSPEWVSDYTFEALHRRLAAIAGLQDDHAARATAEPWLSLAVAPDGAVRFERRHVLPFIPEGEVVAVELLDMLGQVVDEVEGSFLAFQDVQGGTLVVPDPGEQVVAVRLSGQLVPLD